jgi:pimeloyl-ACP methyl ester carboxylesterase
MESLLLPYKHSFIHYLKFGQGTKFLFCFHGYGEDAQSFSFLRTGLGNDYTLIAIDFPYHGKTEWNEGLEFSPDDLQQIINSIVPLELQTISLLGYSMGGRIALVMLQEFPTKIERVVLIAPDGLHKNFWYWFSTQTRIGNRLFDYTMKKPHWFFSGMVFLKTFRLLNKSIYKFAHTYLDDAYERASLYKRWTTMRKFVPDASAITASLKQSNIPIKMLFGSYDKVILSERSTSLDKANDTITVKKIKVGHQLLKEKYLKEIAVLFYE